MPRILIVGGEGRGSWRMRGLQIGQALGARVTHEPTADDWQWAQVAILVKRAAPRHRPPRPMPVIWDVLDCWAQPEENHLSALDHQENVAKVARETRATVLLGSTEAMATAIGGIYLPHHARIGLVPTSPRPRTTTVGYDGNARYLGAWRAALERACARMGLEFVVNPAHLSTVDVLVAFRDGKWDGWVCREWKSGVKYVNAIAAGRPVLTQACAAFDEIQPVGATVANRDGVERALEAVLDPQVRQQAYERGREVAGRYTVRAIADRYRRIIAEAMGRAAA